MKRSELFIYDNEYLIQLVHDLEGYIQKKLSDSAYYERLSNLAPSTISKEILMEFSIDEKLHAENFQNIYCILKGTNYSPKPIDSIQSIDYEKGLIERISEETNDYKKYGQSYLNAPTNYLQDLFFNIRNIEAQHAMKLPILLEELWG